MTLKHGGSKNAAQWVKLAWYIQGPEFKSQYNKKRAGNKNVPGELVKTTGLWILHFRPCSHCGAGSKNLSPKGFSGAVTDDDGVGPELEKCLLDLMINTSMA